MKLLCLSNHIFSKMEKDPGCIYLFNLLILSSVTKLSLPSLLGLIFIFSGCEDVRQVSAVQCIICPALAIRKYREMCILSPSLWKWPNAEKRDSISNRIEKKLNPKWHLIQAADMSEPNHFCCSSLDSKTLEFVKSSLESIFYRRMLSIAKYKTDIMKIRYHQFFFLSSKCQIRFWER